MKAGPPDLNRPEADGPLDSGAAGGGVGVSGLSWWRHGAGFVAAGLIALFCDMGITSALTRGFDIPPLLARSIAIAVAIVVAWRSHRWLTFNVQTPSTLAEFIRYVGVAWTSIAANYTLYAVLLWAVPEMAPEVALVIASLGAMFVSYFGMRFAAFRSTSSLGA